MSVSQAMAAVGTTVQTQKGPLFAPVCQVMLWIWMVSHVLVSSVKWLHVTQLTLLQCLDVDECLSNRGGCAQVCTNTVGSFECSCNPGYSLASAGSQCNGEFTSSMLDDFKLILRFIKLHKKFVIIACVNVYLTDLNECLTENGGCRQTCTNTVGSFVCSCNEGYTLASDGRNCTGKSKNWFHWWSNSHTVVAAISDIDECQINMAGCAHSCYNTIGSFTCDCMPGYALDNDDSTCNGKRERQSSFYILDPVLLT